MKNSLIITITENKTLQEIFINKSDLPTFSSPAIETHIHRIENLSKRFLYLNDDIIFAKRVHPEDFYTKSKGFKVYLSWPVPNCADGCPMSWLKDGYCDKACNTSSCLWDGGDCQNVSGAIESKVFIPNRSRQHFDMNQMKDMNEQMEKQFCSINCANNWLNDNFCDSVCNNENCAYDMGDCGLEGYHQLSCQEFNPEKTIYEIENVKNAFYFNLSNFLLNPNTTINNASFDFDPAIRISTLNIKHQVFTVLLYLKYQNKDLNLTGVIHGKENNTDFAIRFQVKLYKDDNNNLLKSNHTLNDSFVDDFEGNEYHDFKMSNDNNNNRSSRSSSSSTHSFHRSSHTNKTGKINAKVDSSGNLKDQYQKMNLSHDDLSLSNHSLPCDFNLNELPEELKHKIAELNRRTLNENKTITWFENGKKELILLYINHLCNFESTLKGYDKSLSSFKWEKHGVFQSAVNDLSEIENQSQTEFVGDKIIIRHLMDTYADSLRHVNHLYNKVFGLEMRKVPAHMAHFIDIDIMTRLHNQFVEQFKTTSSHKIRSSNDMQFAFSYYYFLISEKKLVNISDVFDEFDVDNSG